MQRRYFFGLVLLAGIQFAQASDKSLNRVGVPSAMQDFDAYQNQRFNPLFDAGSWHGFMLPDRADYAGAFTGPLIVFEEYSLFLADALERFQIKDNLSGKLYEPSKAVWTQHSQPGVLTQTLRWDTLSLHLDLHFLNASDALVRYRLENKSTESLQLSWNWQGKLLNSWDKKQTVSERFPNWKIKLNATPDGVHIAFGAQRDILNLMTSGTASYHIVRSLPAQTIVGEQSYQSLMSLPPLAANAEQVFYSMYRYQLSEPISDQKSDHAPVPLTNTASLFANADRLIQQSQDRWSRWQAKLPATALSVKAFETLIANWRAPAGKVKHDMLVPSTTARWFNGAWAWDSWKHAYALAAVEPQLGKNVMRSMLDYQIGANDPLRPQDAGMVIDTVFYNQDAARGGDGDHWNERNSKPPLAAWAAWELFQQTHDKDWLREVRPRLEAYHAWWYRNRDHNQNGLAEYGASVHPVHTNSEGQLKFSLVSQSDPGVLGCQLQSNAHYQCVGIDAYDSVLRTHQYQQLELPVQEAAAYESGMDNAARFGYIDGAGLQRYADLHYQGDVSRARADWQVRIFENRDPHGKLQGYSISQESVDLNAFLYQEKRLLARIAEVLDDKAASRRWHQQAQALKRKIQKCFYDADTGFFYDRQIDVKLKQDRNDGRGRSDTCEGRLLTQRGRGPEGWAPLWVGAASQRQAKAVMRTIMNPQEFFTEVPLPTASLTNPAYDPESYWRGRVWLDQVYFAIVGLHRYGFHSQARQVQEKLMNGAMGLRGDAPIRENYHPRTGRMQGASNFSWSAAHLLMLERLQNQSQHRARQ